MSLEETKNYLDGEFTQGAKEFLLRTGVWNNGYPLEVLLEKFNAQMRQVKEESLEYLGAYGTDKLVEKLDGLVDFHFTLVNWKYISEQLFTIIGDDLSKMRKFEEIVNEELIDLMNSLVPVGLTLKNPSLGTPQFVIAAKRIIANNRLKYTDNYEEAKSWEIDLSDGLETKLTTTNVDGKDWYCLTDNMGKVRKRIGFTPVKLEDLVGDDSNV